MVPATFATSVAVIFIAGGLLTCFGGYRLFRFVLGLYGFYAGAMIGSSSVDPGSTFAVIMGLLVGGVAGAIVMVFAYFVAVGLAGAGLAATALHLVWRLVGSGDPPTLVLILVCVVGAVLALQVQRTVVIVGTAVLGAWTAVTGMMAFIGEPNALNAASAPNIRVIYPADLFPSSNYVLLGMITLAVVGMAVQFKTTTATGKKRLKKT